MRSSPETRTGSAKNAGVFSAAVREEYFLNILQSFLITLSMYTVIPMPATEWNGRNLRYCMAFLPAAGFVISAAEWVLFFVCYSLHLSDVFFASFFCALPVLVTGKIHIDGLIDTCDALGSHGAREKKLQILDDPHAGAFGIASAVVYFLLFFGVAAELYPLLTPETAAAVFLVFAASRAMAAAQIVTMRPALYFSEGGFRQRDSDFFCGGFAVLSRCGCCVLFLCGSHPRGCGTAFLSLFSFHGGETIRWNFRRSVRLADSYAGTDLAAEFSTGAAAVRRHGRFLLMPGCSREANRLYKRERDPQF